MIYVGVKKPNGLFIKLDFVVMGSKTATATYTIDARSVQGRMKGFQKPLARVAVFIHVSRQKKTPETPPMNQCTGGGGGKKAHGAISISAEYAKRI